jgi:hypothetical protein
MPSKQTERQIDDALLATTTTAGFLYVRRRFRRALAKAQLATTVAAGLGGLAIAGAAIAWLRRRSRAQDVV